MNGFFSNLGESYNVFRSFSSEKKVSLIIFTGDIFHFEDLAVDSLLDRTTTKEAKSKDDNTEPCTPIKKIEDRISLSIR